MHFGEGVENFLIFAVEAGLVAIEEREGGVGAGQRFEREGEAVDVVDFDELLVDALFVDGPLVFEQRGLDGGVTGESPICRGELADEIEFGFVLGLEVVEVVMEFGLVFAGGFIGEDDGAGAESVGAGVVGDFGFALGGSGAGGELGVTSIGFDFQF